VLIFTNDLLGQLKATHANGLISISIFIEITIARVWTH
jgi:hypothetical protein